MSYACASIIINMQCGTHRIAGQMLSDAHNSQIAGQASSQPASQAGRQVGSRHCQHRPSDGGSAWSSLDFHPDYSSL